MPEKVLRHRFLVGIRMKRLPHKISQKIVDDGSNCHYRKEGYGCRHNSAKMAIGFMAAGQ